ncbi:hypothetical protein [Taibaiella chishuiensis]|uniref:Lipocalin-like protein n=1 Tax=Taibaiella chishuiensis TaxID=1434707 RepID=A0A2P8D484_9BACT|nr:hypothetical protein [Taibaiella chishuiensis]PSK92033.1 hypothetical protein B0I18_104127 [Taibaiella chishuiensis]
MRKLLLAGLGFTLLFASCSKSEEDKQPIDVSKTKMLMSGKWQLKAYVFVNDISDPTSMPLDYYTPLPGCEKDNFFIFNTTNQVSLYEGNTKCAATAPDSTVYNYNFTNDEKYLKIYSNPDDVDNSLILWGDVKYPTVDSFVIYYTTFNSTTEITSGHTKTYTKQ